MERYSSLIVVHFTDRFYGNILARVLHIVAHYGINILEGFINSHIIYAHRWRLGPLINQDHICLQLIMRNIKLLNQLVNSQDNIVNKLHL